LQKDNITGKYLNEVIDLHLVSAIENALAGTVDIMKVSLSQKFPVR